MKPSTPNERLNWSATQGEIDQIRNTWLKHVENEVPENLNVEAAIETMTDDCLYEIVEKGIVLEGHDGAREFYRQFFGAFPDVEFELLDVSVGPQGVFGCANMTATMKQPFFGIQPPSDGKKIH
jgi:predicted ester cyclase